MTSRRPPRLAVVAGVAGSAGTGPVPSPGLDWQVLLEALAAGGFLEGDPDDQDAVAAAERDAVADGRMSAPLPAGQAGALAVEHMDPGPAQAGWLAAAAGEAARLDEYGLAGVAIAARQLASWAHCRRARLRWRSCPPGPRPLTATSGWGRTGDRRGCAATRWARYRWR